MPERISYVTDDGVTVVGDWVTAPTTIGAVILLHMMPVLRQSWASFQRALAQRGLASLAIDLRGHGESVKGPDGKPLDFKKFTDGEHASTIHDVRGAYAWLRSRGIDRDRIAVAGASIGANLALQFLSEEPQVPAAVLLSPGESYHGVETADAADYVLPHQGVWMAASGGDDAYSAASADKLMGALQVEQKVHEKLLGAGHGTKMFETHPELSDKLADWLRDRVLAVK
ncbi:hypothetical protein A3E39_02425 [Candidatus Uhrbacteria bacterium RIFCSPHIGHO2_12_FULL_60_25]|uniref:AB hydrolase-1 domain-containing protein n=1 Tax=Candidatus Uhrbacteria bacterium RIFCSPHIGHO2_12_FULL_60_25 TaxID=1802399 RepID=A0A1F7UN02_9BACT|nr:MAG: hypothetical protein A3D73_00490 [Candidatus Uhrbacteria bacterium RIFCSPHIGHO2_02_FULL_60_44]OGL79078.1 MAG: hypothetical protein A3E39_02425 [Candidatus Uhrbacteria bacterium RIFCSPHIGHO2_12_FULL_60_25]